ncbi:3-oxo-5-alpha-steroid 4-dehydrogenase 1-like isoform X2 [Mya arenaria]|uniref:3-oxo-5-alpha-steroid 4-dehydrogenase 1-like isoform X2 n=1 Tax=Mya arenaria TaxID=6604 RepID=UPI0022E5654B|nr:3-oxo-5-alpha-steroid 4-dehydrogenase 1-like isoform X2 [Mya arenaria]
MANMFENILTLILDKDIIVLNIVSYIYFGTAVLVFLLLYSGITAPYGRYARGGWGLFVNGKIAWFVQEIPSFLVPVAFIVLGAPKLTQMPNVLLFTMFTIHYFQRACIFPFLIKGGKPTPFMPFSMALVFCLVNGYLQSAYILHHAEYGAEWWTRPHLWIGVCLFFTGMLVNIHADHVLRNLRRPGETGYKIPRGGMFELVSGANFFGEMLEWFGFAVACWSLPAAAFSCFTCCNIGPRAWQHHNWYLQKFEDYPKSRKAVIPFIL